MLLYFNVLTFPSEGLWAVGVISQNEGDVLQELSVAAVAAVGEVSDAPEML